ncbi:MAG: hypothetical protein KC519_00570 [Anaerolineae bacterium]|nr:hypothetical protein [Anaerolineae bacterium]
MSKGVLHPYRMFSIIYLLSLSLASCSTLFGETELNLGISKHTVCLTPCWQGIQPAISDREEVERILHDLSINFEETMTIVEDDTYRWTSDIPELASGAYRENVNVSVSFDENDLVWQIAFVPTDICSQRIIDWFGIPPIVLRYENDEHIDLAYPKEGLIFLINLHNSERIGAIFIRTQLSTQSWIDQYRDDERSSWEEVETVLTQNCLQDADKINPFFD